MSFSLKNYYTFISEALTLSRVLTEGFDCLHRGFQKLIVYFKKQHIETFAQALFN